MSTRALVAATHSVAATPRSTEIRRSRAASRDRKGEKNADGTSSCPRRTGERRTRNTSERPVVQFDDPKQGQQLTTVKPNYRVLDVTTRALNDYYEPTTSENVLAEKKNLRPRMRIAPSIAFIFALTVVWTTSRAVPLPDRKNTLDQDTLQPVATSACTPDGRCWGWVPVQDLETDVIVPGDIAVSRLHTRRQISNSNTGSAEPWNDSVPHLEKRLQVPAATRQYKTKKDVFLSRGWGAGGMPFSVLYMNTRNNHASSTPQPETSTPNYRVATRNGPAGQPRRQFPIIPQLFISYGWGPIGK